MADTLDNFNNTTSGKSFWFGQYWKEIRKINYYGYKNFFYLILPEKIKLQLQFYQLEGEKKVIYVTFHNFMHTFVSLWVSMYKYKNKM